MWMGLPRGGESELRITSTPAWALTGLHGSLRAYMA